MTSLRALKLSSLISLLFLLATTAHADTYEVDNRHTFPVFEIEHYSLSIQRGRFNKTTGVIQYDKEKRRVAAEITIDAKSVDMGLADRDELMRSEKFLHTEKFPSIRFVIPEFQLSDAAKVNFIPGQLTLRGVIHPVMIAAQISCGQPPQLARETCGANIETTIKRSDFGMAFGLPGIGDEVNIIASVEAFKVAQKVK
jgi:polyisoprenoid-binding protein YceI